MAHLEAGARHRITLTLNGRNVTGDAEPRMLASDWLRQVLGVSGTHVGCEHGVCGACTIRINGKALRSCLMFAVQLEGCTIDTVEGLDNEQGELSDLQSAFRRLHALQCGYCTPGILMSFSQLLDEEPGADEARIRDVLSGHICRCTGYQGLVDAALEIFAARRNNSGKG